MKPRIKGLVLFLSFVALISVSCNKDKDEKSKTELLTTNNWKITKYEEKVNSGAYTDDFPNWTACDKDDEIDFATGGTYTVLYGTLKCDPSETNPIDQGMWAFTSNETKLTLDGEEATIETLNSSNLVVVSTYTFGLDTYTTRITFSH